MTPERGLYISVLITDSISSGKDSASKVLAQTTSPDSGLLSLVCFLRSAFSRQRRNGRMMTNEIQSISS